jgi:hypothetical protein
MVFLLFDSYEDNNDMTAPSSYNDNINDNDTGTIRLQQQHRQR